MTSLNLNGSTPHTPPQEQEEITFFQPEEISSNGDQPEVKIYLANHAKGDPNYYKRLGFYCALDTVQSPNEKFLELLSEQKAFIRDRRSGVELYYFAKEERYNQRIRDTQKKLEDEKTKLIGHVAELDEAIKEEQKYEQEVTRLESELNEAMVMLGKRKENLITDAIHAVRKHLEDLTENYRKAYEDRFKINERTFEDNRPALEIKTEKFRQLRAVAEEQWGRILQKMQALQLDGVNPFLARWLFYLGLSIATVCGAYFFSIFTLTKNLNDENVTFFFLSGLQHFINGLFLPGIAVGWQFAILAASLAAILVLIAGVAFLCWKLLKRFDPETATPANESEQVFAFNSGEETKLSIEINTQSGNFYQFWLQLTPVIAVMGILLLIVFLGWENSPGNGAGVLQKLDISLTGATIGVLITLMVAGISYLYILRIVEPRAERNYAAGKMYLANFELVFTALVFIIATFSLFALDTGPNHQLVLFEYIALVLSNGFLLGYALRMKGLFSTLGFLERKILELSNAIRDNARPKPLSFTAKEDAAFRKEYFRLQKELYHLLLLKTQQGNTALGGANVIQEKKPANRIFRWWGISLKKWIAGSDPEDAPTLEPDVLLEWEKRLYPENHAIIKENADNLKRSRARWQDTRERVAMLKEERTPYCEVLKNNMRRLEDSLDGTKREREKILFNKARDFTALHVLSDTIQADLREGFNLGVWFRSEVGPDRPPATAGSADFDLIVQTKIPPATPKSPDPTGKHSKHHSKTSDDE